MGDHRVKNIQDLYDTSTQLLNYTVKTKGDGILNDLSSGITNLKQNWKGKAAGVRIQEVIEVYNAMVSIRNALGNLAVSSAGVAVHYREIENINSSGRAENLSKINCESVSPMENYTDTSDMIDVNALAVNGKTYIDTACSSLDEFHSSVVSKYESIMGNWLSGPGRDNAQEAFDTFINNVNKYKTTLEDVSSNISNALSNYGG